MTCKLIWAILLPLTLEAKFNVCHMLSLIKQELQVIDIKYS